MLLTIFVFLLPLICAGLVPDLGLGFCAGPDTAFRGVAGFGFAGIFGNDGIAPIKLSLKIEIKVYKSVVQVQLLI